MTKHSIFYHLDQWWQERNQTSDTEKRNEPRSLRHWLPTPGNTIFTLVIVFVLLWAQEAGAMSLLIPFNSPSQSSNTIAYQGRLADSAGNSLTNTLNMSFRLYTAVTGGTPLWTEQWAGSNGVQVSDGLFNVMLGSLTPIPQNVITENSNLFLGITVGTDDEMSPRVQLGSVPFATQALTVPDGSITKAKLAADVSLVPPDGSITTEKIANGAVTAAKAPNLIALASGANTSLYYGWDSIAPNGSTRQLSKTVSIAPSCQRSLYVFIQPQAYYTGSLSTTIALGAEQDRFTVNFVRLDNLTWEIGAGQGFYWLALCG